MTDLPGGPADAAHRRVGWQLRGTAWLFVPADRPDRVRRAITAADHVVIDLEDAVDSADRPTARAGLAEAVAGSDPASLMVRINALSSPDAAADLRAVHASGITTIMLPKAEDAAEIAATPLLAGLDVVALCETARGVVQADELAAVPRVVALMWGSVDLAADLGCRDDDPALLHARHTVLYAARAAGRAAVDRACPDLTDDVVAADARRAAASGYDAKAVLHPRHVPSVHAAFAPEPDEIAWAEHVLAGAHGAGAQRIGATFADAAVLLRARRILARRSPTS